MHQQLPPWCLCISFGTALNGGGRPQYAVLHWTTTSIHWLCLADASFTSKNFITFIWSLFCSNNFHLVNWQRFCMIDNLLAGDLSEFGISWWPSKDKRKVSLPPISPQDRRSIHSWSLLGFHPAQVRPGLMQIQSGACSLLWAVSEQPNIGF